MAKKKLDRDALAEELALEVSDLCCNLRYRAEAAGLSEKEAAELVRDIMRDEAQDADEIAHQY